MLAECQHECEQRGWWATLWVLGLSGRGQGAVRGARGKRQEKRAVREGSQGRWRHSFWVGLPVVGVLEVTVWNL